MPPEPSPPEPLPPESDGPPGLLPIPPSGGLGVVSVALCGAVDCVAEVATEPVSSFFSPHPDAPRVTARATSMSAVRFTGPPGEMGRVLVDFPASLGGSSIRRLSIANPSLDDGLSGSAAATILIVCHWRPGRPDSGEGPSRGSFSAQHWRNYREPPQGQNNKP